MADETTDKNKVQLLFKEFTGVVNSKQDAPFPLEGFAFKDYILNDNILSDSIPASLPDGLRSAQLDACGNIAPNSTTNLASSGYPQLTYHKKRILQPVVSGSYRTWYLPDASGGSLLKNAISFKFDPINNSYNYGVYQAPAILNPGPPPLVYLPIGMYTFPTFWLFDFKSGFLEFYAEEDSDLIAYTPSGGVDLLTNPPAISFFQYVGATGGAGGGGGGGSQSLTIEPWPEPTPVPPNTTSDIYYVLATVPISTPGALGNFSIQLGEPYEQVMSFYAGIMEQKGPVIKILSNTNKDQATTYANRLLSSNNFSKERKRASYWWRRARRRYRGNRWWRNY